MKKNVFKVTLLMAAMAFSFTSFAQEAKKGDMAAKFAKADTNGDKKLDKAEVEATGNTKMLRAFVKIDTNSDGFISIDEMKAFKKAKKAAAK